MSHLPISSGLYIFKNNVCLIKYAYNPLIYLQFSYTVTAVNFFSDMDRRRLIFTTEGDFCIGKEISNSYFMYRQRLRGKKTFGGGGGNCWA